MTEDLGEYRLSELSTGLVDGIFGLYVRMYHPVKPAWTMIISIPKGATVVGLQCAFEKLVSMLGEDVATIMKNKGGA